MQSQHGHHLHHKLVEYLVNIHLMLFQKKNHVVINVI